MNRKLRPSILALLAALTVSVAAAPSASAESFIFSADAAEMELTGAQHGAGDVFTTNAGTVKCSSITYTGTSTSDEMETVELAPTYSGCTAFGSASTEVKANGCQYRLNPKTIEGSNFEGDMDIVCPGGSTITATVKVGGLTACTVHIPAQEGLGSVTYANVENEPDELTVSLNLSGMKYSYTAGLGCSSGSFENGTYQGAGLFTGHYEEESGSLGVDKVGTWMSVTPKPLNFKKMKKGEKTNLTIKNEYATRKYIREMKIVDVSENVEEGVFKIVAQTCGGDLKTLEECTVQIENLTEETKTRWFRFKWSGWGWFATRHTIKRDVGHE